MKKEIVIANAGERPNQHILRIAGDRSHAANIRRSGDRKQIRQGLQLHAPRDAKHKGYHYQADDIVHQKCRKKPASENDRRQQMGRLQSLQNYFRIPLEEAHQAQVADDQHHRKQKHESGEVDEAQRIRRPHHPEGDHGNRSDDRRAWTVYLEARKLADRENQIARQENDVCRGQAGVWHCRGQDQEHGKRYYQCQERDEICPRIATNQSAGRSHDKSDYAKTADEPQARRH